MIMNGMQKAKYNPRVYILMRITADQQFIVMCEPGMNYANPIKLYIIFIYPFMNRTEFKHLKRGPMRGW